MKEFIIKPNQQRRFDALYQRHLRALKLQGLSDKTIDVYARAVRRVAHAFDCCPDRLTTEQLESHFAKLVESHSWSTVKVDRNGLQFFYKHVLNRDWSWIDLIKAPTIQSLPDILSLAELEQLIGAARKLRYRVFLLTTYSMGLRLGGKTVAQGMNRDLFFIPHSATSRFMVFCTPPRSIGSLAVRMRAAAPSALGNSKRGLRCLHHTARSAR